MTFELFAINGTGVERIDPLVKVYEFPPKVAVAVSPIPPHVAVIRVDVVELGALLVYEVVPDAKGVLREIEFESVKPVKEETDAAAERIIETV
jgi:hypothetical protein